MTTPCPGTCNSRYRSARKVYEAAVEQHAAIVARLEPGQALPEAPAPPPEQPMPGEPIWCVRCTSLIRRELAELDELAAQLAALPPGVRPVAGHRPDKVKVSSPDAPSPSPAADDLDQLLRWLRSYEDAYRDLRGWESAPQRGKLTTPTTAVINWLRYHLTGGSVGILENAELAEEFGLGIRQWHKSLRAITHTESYARHVNQPCPKCKRYTLWEQPGDEYVKCVYEDCQARHTREELRDAARV